MWRCLFLALLSSWPSAAEAFDADGTDLHERDEFDASLDGYARLRGALLSNFDLDRGLTPSGRPLHPVPDDPAAQLFGRADARVRTDVALYPPGYGVAIKARLDTLDNVTLGFARSWQNAISEDAPPNVLRLKRAYAEVATPFGILSGGRMGIHWGLGLLANGGDCLDCDAGTAADRIQFSTHVGGHSWTIAYDFTAISQPRPLAHRVVDVERHDEMQTLTLAVLRRRTAATRARRARADKLTFEYGAFYTHRRQDEDGLIRRGFVANTVDVWLALHLPWLRLEAEAAAIFASVDEPAVLPGIDVNSDIQARQIGVAFESEAGPGDGSYGIGVDGGYASGDPAPGFGAFAEYGPRDPEPGEIDGVQARLGTDDRIDNFRFHSDYRIDRILFREIIGTVTDVVYVRPHAKLRLFSLGASSMTLAIAGVASFAAFATSTPGGASPLGVEIDPTLTYAHEAGFSAGLEYAALVPFAGLDNPSRGLAARPAQLGRVRLTHQF